MSKVEIVETTKLTISLPEDLVDFLLKFCKWAGYGPTEYIVTALISDMEAILNNIDPIVPSIEELKKEIQELKKRHL